MKKVETMKFDYEFGGPALDLDNVPPRIRKILDALNRLPDGKLIDDARLAEVAGVNYDTVRHDTTFAAIKPYKILIRNHRLWGNLKTIESWKAQNGKA